MLSTPMRCATAVGCSGADRLRCGVMKRHSRRQSSKPHIGVACWSHGGGCHAGGSAEARRLLRARLLGCTPRGFASAFQRKVLVS